MPATARQVAEWMLAELDQDGCLHQDGAVASIIDRFGEAFAWHNDNGNPAIDKKVLDEFLTLTGDSVVWSRGFRLWRRREAGDEVGRQQP